MVAAATSKPSPETVHIIAIAMKGAHKCPFVAFH